ncbi:holliday junction resolvase [Nitrososphaeria virus YSH_462411]|uniref:Holliday junction resolvase n=1 Tax=Nitrososphaeria virus YSH_462411 TaxID=3071321 RepID=A0A976UBF9_9CAUD|nr:holliday junction resolvase [Yangshan Harbor Nitrososphaeria virus]UVF62331.1 holliday junction resolvase [Nitrososphaeria virus YSH_462411]
MYDLIAIPPSNEKQIHNYPLMIQCKTNGYIKPSERESLNQNKYKWQGWQIIAVNENHKIVFKSLEGGKLII